MHVIRHATQTTAFHLIRSDQIVHHPNPPCLYDHALHDPPPAHHPSIVTENLVNMPNTIAMSISPPSPKTPSPNSTHPPSTPRETNASNCK